MCVCGGCGVVLLSHVPVGLQTSGDVRQQQQKKEKKKEKTGGGAEVTWWSTPRRSWTWLCELLSVCPPASSSPDWPGL